MVNLRHPSRVIVRIKKIRNVVLLNKDAVASNFMRSEYLI